MFAVNDVRLILPEVLMLLPTLNSAPEVKLIAPEPVLIGALTVNVPVPEASTMLIVLVPVVVRPFAVPRSSVKLATVKFLFAASLMDRLPVLLLAILLKLFPVLVNVTPVESRKIKFPTKLIAPVCEIAPPESNVKTPVANVDADVNAPELIAPAALLPIRTLVARTSFNIACVKESEPVPPAIPIVVPEVDGVMITVDAAPAPAPVPPICDVALNDIVLEVNVAVPVVNNKEAAFNVIAPIPPVTFSAPLPELIFVLAA